VIVVVGWLLLALGIGVGFWIGWHWRGQQNYADGYIEGRRAECRAEVARLRGLLDQIDRNPPMGSQPIRRLHGEDN